MYQPNFVLCPIGFSNNFVLFASKKQLYFVLLLMVMRSTLQALPEDRLPKQSTDWI